MNDQALVAATKLVPNEIDSHQFDYGSFAPSVSRFLRGQATRIRQYTAKSIIQIGKDLIGAKHYLSHGEFLDWVESEVGLAARTAQAYMRVANWALSKSATVALLPPTALYALASSGVPSEFVEEVLTRVENGERIKLPSLRAEIKALRGTPQRCNPSAFSEAPANFSDFLDPIANPGALILRAVEILARALPARDFAVVREIITSKQLLEDPNLPRLIEHAFCQDTAVLNVDTTGFSTALV